jgi:hypothetical protein
MILSECQRHDVDQQEVNLRVPLQRLCWLCLPISQEHSTDPRRLAHGQDGHLTHRKRDKEGAMQPIKISLISIILLIALSLVPGPQAQDSSGLAARVAALEAQIAALQAALAAVQSNTVLQLDDALRLDTTDPARPTAVFNAVNVQIVNGLGATNGLASDPYGVEGTITNGLGNLIIGYNELSWDSGPIVNPPFNPGDRDGSHNLIIGRGHRYPSWGGMVARDGNRIGDFGATVSGGRVNVASGRWSSVSGGRKNTASGAFASVSGGARNVASGTLASVSGGADNVASGEVASVSGGSFNEAASTFSSANGGTNNIATGRSASVSGGQSNEAGGTNGSVSGGVGNTASADDASISGGVSQNANTPGCWKAETAADTC